MGERPPSGSALCRLGGTLYVGGRKTTVKDRRKEIGPGLLNKMLSDLGIDRNEL